MSFKSFLTERLQLRLRRHRALVCYDPAQRYETIVAEMGGGNLTLVNAGADLLEAREQCLEALVSLGEDATCRKQLLVYVPRARPLEDGHQCLDPFAMCAVAGGVFPDGAGDEYRALCLEYLPEQAGQIESMFATGEEPTVDVISSLRSSATDSPVLQQLLEADGPKDMLIRFLTAEKKTISALKTTGHWIKDFKELVLRTLGLKMDGSKEEIGELQSTLWRYLLFSEFAQDLPGELPASLASVPHAGPAHAPFVRALCDTLRDLGKAQSVYEESAERVAAELGIEHVCEGVTDFGERDTFSFEERDFLRRFTVELAAKRLEEAREIVVSRRNTFWVQRDARRSTEWQLADLAARLLLELETLQPEIKQQRKLEGWIEFYTSTFARVDTLHRAMEQVAADLSPVGAPLDVALQEARSVHQTASDSMARKFQAAILESGWPAASTMRAVDVFDRCVEPRWRAGERVAYFWIDAFRYELAQALEATINSRHPSKLDPVCASMPCLTPVGMAALLPGASGALEIDVEEGKPRARVKDKIAATPKDRADILAAHVGTNRSRMVDLEDLLVNNLTEELESVEVLAVKTTDIDSLGENNPGYLITMLPGFLRKIELALNHLANAGFTRAILATDHGFGWMNATSSGNAVSKPQGDWKMAKDRVLLGEGSDDAYSYLYKTADIAVRSKLPHLAVPKGMATFTNGVTYFHGGFSPQECILPLLDVELKPAVRAQTAQRLDITLTYRGAKEGLITTLTPSLELTYPAADLFGPPSVRILITALDSAGKVIGQAAASHSVDPATREVNLERAKAIKVPIRIQEGFEGNLTVIAADPATGAQYASVKLKTNFFR